MIILLACILVVWSGSEIAFRVMEHNIDRAPQVIELTIPPGTAEKVARGESVPTIPEEMVFVLGDVLVVHNEDSVSHELGPVLVPPGTSGSLPMDEADKYSVHCSFQPTEYLGLEVKEPTTWLTRLIAIAFAAPATAVLVFLYSIAIKPVTPPTEGSAEKE